MKTTNHHNQQSDSRLTHISAIEHSENPPKEPDTPSPHEPDAPAKPYKNPDPTRPEPGVNEPEKNDPTRKDIPPEIFYKSENHG
jgi:hypothetical protein